MRKEHQTLVPFLQKRILLEKIVRKFGTFLSSIPVKKRIVPFFPISFIFHIQTITKKRILLFRINIPGITAFLCDGLIITLKSYYFFPKQKSLQKKQKKRQL